MRTTRSFNTTPARRSQRRRRRGHAGTLPGVPCGTASRAIMTCIDGKDCPPAPACPEPQPCPPQRPCPPQLACPPCPEPPLCPECEACDCPPQVPCPECEACPECEECPEYGCEDACETLHGYGTDDYYKCIENYCEEGTPTPRPRPMPPIAARPWDPPRPPSIPQRPLIPATSAPDPGCIEVCKQRYAAGQISKSDMLKCLYDCCFAEAIADGHTPDMANRICAEPVPATPTPKPSCEQRCRGRYGVGTQAYYDCVQRECTFTAEFAPLNPYIP